MSKDLGVDALGTAEHKDMICRTIFSNNTFRMAGNKVSLRRWFGWLGSAEFHLPVWHSRLLSIVALGQQLGVYKSWLDVPLWKGQADFVRARAAQKEVDDDDTDLLGLVGDGEDGHDEEDDDDEDRPNPRADRMDVGDADAARFAADGVDAARVQASEDKGSTKDNAKDALKGFVPIPRTPSSSHHTSSARTIAR